MITYLLIGIGVAITLDSLIYITRSSSQLTAKEIFVCILAWPMVLLTLVYYFIQQ
jgi:hypothetical protein